MLLFLWFAFRKDKSLIKFLQDAIPFLFIGVVLYFWHEASGWENGLSEDWARDPLLSNASATLEYVKALVKTIMLGGVALITMLYLKNGVNAKHDPEIKNQQ